MSETIQQHPTPDAKRDFNQEPVERYGPNCVGFVLSKLGILDKERFIKPGPLDSYRGHFDEVENELDAQVVAITVTNPVDGTQELVHLALMDPSNKKFY